MSYIGIGDIIKLDQKNRLHIPKNLMKLAKIDENSFVIVSIDIDGDCIKIYSANKYINEEMIKQIEGDK